MSSLIQKFSVAGMCGVLVPRGITVYGCAFTTVMHPIKKTNAEIKTFFIQIKN